MTATVAPPLTVTIADAAARLGVHRSTIWRMERDGQIRTIKVRGRLLVPVAELDRLVAGEAVQLLHHPVGEPTARRIEKRRLIPPLSR